jgi:hypothetical protein
MAGRHSILYGDIHNHNAHGYGVGSIERSLEVARTHLDFFAITGHSSWHDMPSMEGGRERHWIDGFKRLKETWPRVQAVIAAGNRDGEFCSFLGSDKGLGLLMLQVQVTLDTPGMFMAVFVITLIGVVLYGIVMALERWLVVKDARLD